MHDLVECFKVLYSPASSELLLVVLRCETFLFDQKFSEASSKITQLFANWKVGHYTASMLATVGVIE